MNLSCLGNSSASLEITTKKLQKVHGTHTHKCAHKHAVRHSPHIRPRGCSVTDETSFRLADRGSVYFFRGWKLRASTCGSAASDTYQSSACCSSSRSSAESFKANMDQTLMSVSCHDCSFSGQDKTQVLFQSQVLILFYSSSVDQNEFQKCFKYQLERCMECLGRGSRL